MKSEIKSRYVKKPGFVKDLHSEILVYIAEENHIFSLKILKFHIFEICEVFGRFQAPYQAPCGVETEWILEPTANNRTAISGNVNSYLNDPNNQVMFL